MQTWNHGILGKPRSPMAGPPSLGGFVGFQEALLTALGVRRLTRDSRNRRLTRDSRIPIFSDKKLWKNPKNRFFGLPGPK